VAYDLTSLSTLPVITGELTLDAESNPNAVFIFRTSALTTAASQHVILVNGASPNNIYWSADTAFFGATVTMQGNVFVKTAMTFGAGCTLHGRYVSNSTHTAIFLRDILPPSSPCHT